MWLKGEGGEFCWEKERRKEGKKERRKGKKKRRGEGEKERRREGYPIEKERGRRKPHGQMVHRRLGGLGEDTQ